MKWYVVPTERAPSSTTPAEIRPAVVMDQDGQQVAEFEMMRDAEAAVAAFNGQNDRLVSLPIWEAS